MFISRAKGLIRRLGTFPTLLAAKEWVTGFLFLQKKHSIFGNFHIKLLFKTECTIKPFQLWNISASELLAYSISHVHSQHVRAASP